MANVCRKIYSFFSWIRIPLTFGQIEEDISDTDVIETSSSTDPGEDKERRDTRTQTNPSHSTKYNGMVSSIQLLIILVVAMSVATLSRNVPKRSDGGALKLVEVGFIFTGLVIMISIYKCPERFLRMERKSTGKSKRDNLVLIGIVTFCALSCLYNFFHILESLSCCSVWILCSNKNIIKRQVVRVVNHLFKIIYLVGQTVFCMLFNKSAFVNSSLARHALMYLQAVNVIFWFSLFVEEAVHSFKNQSSVEIIRRERRKFNSCFTNDTVNLSNLNECVARNRSIVSVVHEYADPILRPFIIEYALLVGESLAHWFLTCSKTTPGKQKHEKDETVERRGRSRYTVNLEEDLRDDDDEALTADDSNLLGSTETPPVRLNYRPTTLVFYVGLAVLSNLLLLVLAFLPKILNNAGDASLDHTLYKAYYSYYCVHQTFVILSVLFGYGVSSRFKAKRHATFSGLDYMLLFTSSGPLAICSFKLLAASAENLPAIDYGLIDVYKVCRTLELIQVPIQVVFMLYAGRVVVEKTADNLVRRACFRAIAVFLALSNGCLWCVYTFSSGYIGNHTLDSYYGGTGSVIMKVVLSPVSLFFRFNSCLMFARVFFQTRSKGVK